MCEALGLHLMRAYIREATGAPISQQIFRASWLRSDTTTCRSTEIVEQTLRSRATRSKLRTLEALPPLQEAGLHEMPYADGNDHVMPEDQYSCTCRP
jgi:hypothetical protein